MTYHKPISIVPACQVAQGNGIKMLVYGPAGVGKTVLATTLPESLLVSIESGLLSVAKSTMPTTVVSSSVQLLDVYNWACFSHEARYYSGLAIDSLTELCEVILAETKRLNKDPRKAYFEMQEQTVSIVKCFRDLPGKNVYMAAKQEYQKDDTTGGMMFAPSTPGQKTGPMLPYLFDEVFRMGAAKASDGTTQRFLQTQPDLQYTAKDRSGKLAPLEYPDLGSVIRKIQTQ